MLSGQAITNVILVAGMEPGEIIREAREKRDMSQKELGDLVGISQPAIRKIEGGATLHSKFFPKIAQVLGLDLSILDASLTAKMAVPASGLPPIGSPYGDKDFPIYAAAEGGPGEIIRSLDAVDWWPRPIEVEKVKGAYGMYVVGTSMVPEFEPGQVAVINPNLPFVSGKSYIFYAQDEDGAARATVKRLRKHSDDTWWLLQHNPPAGQKQEFTLSRKLWAVAHRIVGRQDPS